MKLDDEPIHITIDEAVVALRAAAWDDYDYEDEDNAVPNGRKRIHTFTDGGIMIGADWDLEDAEAFADRSIDRAWAGHPVAHELAICADNRIIRFDCKRPS